MKKAMSYVLDIDDWISHMNYSELFDIREIANKEIKKRQDEERYKY